MTLLADESLVDRIYEAAVISDFWPDVMTELVRQTDGAHASFHSVRNGAVRWIGTPEADRLINEYGPLAHLVPNTRPERGRGRAEYGFVTDRELYTPEELETEPFYRDFLRPRGYGWLLGSTFEIPSGDQLYFGIERRFVRGPFEAHLVQNLDALRPHFGRAALLAARLELQRARSATNALETVGLPAAVLGERHRLIAANPSFERLVPAVFQDRRERLVLTDAVAAPLFAEALSGLTQPARASVRSIPIAACEDRPPYIVHLVPVRRAAFDIFSRAACVVIVTPVERAAVPQADVVKGLFDLSPAEARVACGIASAQTIDAVAEAIGVSRETVRTQLKAVLAKTGVSRQAELVSLLAGKALPSDP